MPFGYFVAAACLDVAAVAAAVAAIVIEVWEYVFAAMLRCSARRNLLAFARIEVHWRWLGVRIVSEVAVVAPLSAPRRISCNYLLSCTRLFLDCTSREL